MQKEKKRIRRKIGLLKGKLKYNNINIKKY